MLQVSKQIQQELVQIEQEQNVRIIYACESGSRAWGFPSQDSDYDVRFLYIRPEEWYLSVFDKRDVIERPISDMLDMNGWDLRKALRLFRKSNPPLLEWLQSPIRYMEKSSVAEQIRGLSPLAFSPRSCMYHYLHMAKGNYREYLQGERVKIKKYFYVLRPILACEWIERYNAMPPIEFKDLVDHLVPSDSVLSAAIENLLERKIAGDEMDMELKVDAINEYLEAQITRLEQIALSIPASEAQYERQLDALFRSALKEVWHPAN
ncbi:nucleotidyltransferase domain-containing protein [Paenibacillus aestuarii]|uniref:Nucleotidyltransferase domain-containing protein n=1 Tax=Paenibacillus aestuarii TaxID=516965 RepID=A0ABW0KHN5_9BACL|nr:nucleotidyltransferase domain-containing protein [Paenibacillus aestuarii]